MTATVVALARPYLQLAAYRDGGTSRPVCRVETVHPDDSRHTRGESRDHAEAIRMAEELSRGLGLELRRVAERMG